MTSSSYYVDVSASASEKAWVQSLLVALTGTCVAGVTAAVLLLVPLGSRRTEFMDGSARTVESVSLIDQEGPGIAVVMLVPVVLAALGTGIAAAFRWRPALVFTALLFLVLVLLGMASIGFFFIPVAACFAFAAVHTRPSRRRLR
jgi:hypothetical protein